MYKKLDSSLTIIVTMAFTIGLVACGKPGFETHGTKLRKGEPLSQQEQTNKDDSSLEAKPQESSLGDSIFEGNFDVSASTLFFNYKVKWNDSASIENSSIQWLREAITQKTFISYDKLTETFLNYQVLQFNNQIAKTKKSSCSPTNATELKNYIKIWSQGLSSISIDKLKDTYESNIRENRKSEANKTCLNRPQKTNSDTTVNPIVVTAKANQDGTTNNSSHSTSSSDVAIQYNSEAQYIPYLYQDYSMNLEAGISLFEAMYRSNKDLTTFIKDNRVVVFQFEKDHGKDFYESLNLKNIDAFQGFLTGEQNKDELYIIDILSDTNSTFKFSELKKYSQDDVERKTEFLLANDYVIFTLIKDSLDEDSRKSLILQMLNNAKKTFPLGDI